ncbi:MAG: glycosyltransferase family 4 protein [bacterium]|nr:glycosyltransferase family 4 protein [bacterium]
MSKILLITLEYPPQKGGVASYYQGIVQELKNNEHQVEILSQNLLAKYFWPRWLKTYFILKKYLKESKPDLILVGQVLPLGLAAYLLRKKTPYVVFTHGMDVLMAQKSRRKRWITEKILRYAKFIITNSQFTKNLLTTHYALLTDKISVIHPCPDQTQNNVSQETLDTFSHRLSLTGKNVMLFLGRLVDRKGVDMTLKALPQILKETPNTVFLIAGTGPCFSKLQQFVVSLNLRSSVYFLGEIFEENKKACLALCDILIMPARQIGPDVEGFGLVFLEAALFKKPSIGGRSGGVPEAIVEGQTGLLVDPSDSFDIAHAAISLLKNKELRQKMGEQAFERVQNEFTWPKQIKPLLGQINKL